MTRERAIPDELPVVFNIALRSFNLRQLALTVLLTQVMTKVLTKILPKEPTQVLTKELTKIPSVLLQRTVQRLGAAEALMALKEGGARRRLSEVSHALMVRRARMISALTAAMGLGFRSSTRLTFKASV
jgi:hypothetical protein